MILVAQGSNEIQRIPKEEEKRSRVQVERNWKGKAVETNIKRKSGYDELIKQREQNKIRQANIGRRKRI